MSFRQFLAIGSRFVHPAHTHVAPTVRNFHVTSPRAALPLAVLIKPFLKLGAALSGRTVRNWWRKLPEKQRNVYRQRFFKSQRLFLFAGGTCIFTGGVFYVTHLETVPVTGRKRFVALNDETFNVVLTAERDSMFKSWTPHILPPNHVDSRRTRRLVNRLVRHNADVECMPDSWSVYVVSDDSLVNAVCFPTGEVVVFTGLLRFVENEDQLAFVIGHEMAHVILKHGRELIGYASILDWLGIVVVMALWTIIPSDVFAFAMHWLQERVLHILLQLPYNRSLEREADEVGLSLAARACVDVREASKFWELMDTYEVRRDEGRVPEWVSTHPASLERARVLHDLEGSAMELQEKCGCQDIYKANPHTLVLLRDYLRQRVLGN